MFGPPGTGKKQCWHALFRTTPELSFDESLRNNRHSFHLRNTQRTARHNAPFAPRNHTSSYVSLIGAATFPKPGEVTLAHRGVLFLDEFPEFEKNASWNPSANRWKKSLFLKTATDRGYAATRIKIRRKISVLFSRLWNKLSSSGSRRDSKTRFSNSGNSSKNKTRDGRALLRRVWGRCRPLSEKHTKRCDAGRERRVGDERFAECFLR